MKLEYKKYANREEMLKNTFKNRFFRFLIVPVFAILGIMVVVWDTIISIDIFYAWTIAILVSYIGAFLFIKIGYTKYSLSFFHLDFAVKSLIFYVFISWSFLFTPIYGLYIITNESNDVMFIAVFVVIIYSFIMLIDAYKRMKNNFSSFYSEINGKIFFCQQAYMKCNHTPKAHMVISGLLLFFAGFQFLVMRAFHYPSGFAISMCLVSFMYYFLLYPYMCRAIFDIFVHRCVEKHFNQRLLSDCWGFFELDPALAEKFFGPGPRIKRPIQYEEVFPTRKPQ